MATSPSPPTDHDRGSTGSMPRVTLRLPKQQIEQVESLVDDGEFPNRSEAIRQAVREMISEERS